MQTPEPWAISPELRQQAIDTLAGIIETGTPMEQIEACRVLVEMDSLNMQADSASWIGKLSNN